MVARGELWWIDLGEPVGSAPGFRRPAVVVSSDRFNSSRIATVIVASVTSNMSLAQAPGNVAVTPRDSGLRKDSVVNVSQLLAVDRRVLDTHIGRLPAATMRAVEHGLRLVLGL